MSDEKKYFSLLTNYIVKVRINISIRRKCRIQPERYATYSLENFKKIQ